MDTAAEELRALRESIREATLQQVQAQRDVAEALRAASTHRSHAVAINDAGAAAVWHRATAASNARTAILVLVPIMVGWALWLGLENRELRARIDMIEQHPAVATAPAKEACTP